MNIYKVFYMLLIAASVVTLNSCGSSKEVVYFQDLKPGETEIKLPEVKAITVRPEDKISIIVNSRDPQLTDLFNLPYVTRQLGQSLRTNGVTVSNNQGVSAYTVDANGEIDFPVLGKMYVAGMKREEIAEYIKNELIKENLVKDPVVTVEFANLCISVLGEVNSPGRFSIDRDRLTILDALSMAGDLTIYADFSPIEYTINFENLPTGAVIADQYKTYTIEDSVDFSQIIPEIYGYEFLGWYTDSDLTVPAQNITAGSTGNVTVYASYREIVVTIHFSEQFNDITVPFEATAYGENGVLYDYTPTKDGYTFGGWYTSADFSTRSYIDPNRPYYFTKDVTLYAKWDAQANPAIIWISVAFAELAVVGFVLWWILFRPRYKE